MPAMIQTDFFVSNNTTKTLATVKYSIEGSQNIKFFIWLS
jgi:hypothetical protein